MIRMKDENMGRFSVRLSIANFEDVVRAQAGAIPREQVRSIDLPCVVDSGAAQLVLPESICRQLGLRHAGEAGVHYADGRTAAREIVSGVRLEYADRTGVFNAIVEPGRQDAVIGAIVMEALDLIIACTHGALIPRDPERVIAEIEWRTAA